MITQKNTPKEDPHVFRRERNACRARERED
jgi:hypothetical protein